MARSATREGYAISTMTRNPDGACSLAEGYDMTHSVAVKRCESESTGFEGYESWS